MSVYLYPTDTVWGIGAPMENQQACLRVEEIKKSSSTKPISLLFSSPHEVLSFLSFPVLWTSLF